MQCMETVKIWELYKHARENTQTLLPDDISADFWQIYKTNNTYADRTFNTMYRDFSFVWAAYPGEKDIADAEKLQRFKSVVKLYLLANEKRYSELYRLQVVDDDRYGILDNYDMMETMTRETMSQGEQTKGAQKNGSTIADTEYTDITDRNIGKQHNTQSVSTGEQETTVTHSVAPYDSKTVNIDSQDSATAGKRTDSVDNTTDAYTDTTTVDAGARNRTIENSEGERHDKTSDSGTENYTLTRKGNIGVMTQSDVMARHYDFWERYEYFLAIYHDIATHTLILVS